MLRDLGGRALDATINTGAWRVDGEMGAGFDVGGGTAWITGPAATTVVPTTINGVTGTAWVRPDVVTSDQRVLSLIATGSASKIALVVGRASGQASAFMRAAGGGLIQLDSGASSVAAGALIHLAVTVQHGDGRLYLNGLQVASSNTVDTATTFIWDTSAVGIGGLDGINSVSFDGLIADVRLYSRVLTPAEIWQLYAPQTRWSLYSTGAG